MVGLLTCPCAELGVLTGLKVAGRQGDGRWVSRYDRGGAAAVALTYHPHTESTAFSERAGHPDPAMRMARG